MKGTTFMDAAASSTRVIGRKDSVRVVFEGNRASTDGDVVRLPAIPALADVGEEDADVIRGYRDHETMHVRCTDMAALGLLAAIRNDNLLYQLSQYCEDIRIENAGVQSYPGMRRTFSATNKEAASIIEESIKESGLTVADAISRCPSEKAMMVALQAEARREIGIETGFYDEFVKHIDPKIHEFAKQWAKEMVALGTGVTNGNLNSDKSRRHTADAFDLAKKIKESYTDELAPEIAKQPEPEPEPGPEPGPEEAGQPGQQSQQGQPDRPGTPGDGPGEDNGQQSSDGGDDEGDGEGSGGGDDEGDGEGSGGGDDEADLDDFEGGPSEGGPSEGGPSEGGPSEGGAGADAEQPSSPARQEVDTPPATQPPSGQSGGKGGDATHRSAAVNTEMFDVDYKDALRKIVDEIEQDANSKLAIEYGRKTASWRVYSDRLRIKASIHDLDPISYPKGGMDKRYMAQFDAAHAAVKDRAAMIRRSVELELQARFDRVWQPGHKSGRLHSPRLVDAMHGMENVYQKRETGRDIDTLLVMSIDGSGSMSGEPMSRCQELAIAFGEALERTGADIEVEVWDDSMPANRATQASLGVDSSNDVYKRYRQAVADEINAEAKRLHGVDHAGNVPDPHAFYAKFEAERPKIFASYGNVVRRIVKSRRQRMTDPNTRAALGAMLNLAGGGTPMICAVTWTLLDMIKEKHGKKILLVMTDGEPNSGLEFGEDYAPHLAQMKYLHKLADEHGVHIIGVGIQADVSGYFRDYVSVRSSTAYEKVMKRIASHLKEERRAVRRAA